MTKRQEDKRTGRRDGGTAGRPAAFGSIRRHSVFLFFLSAASAVSAQTDAALPAEVTQLRGALYSELGKLAKEYNGALLPMAEDYVLDLRRTSTRMKDAKDTAGQEAVRKEASRFMKALEAEPDAFETVPELTDEVVKSSVETLRMAQQAYIAKRTVADRLRNEKAAALAEKYAEALGKLDAKLTADGAKLADAAKGVNEVKLAAIKKDIAAVEAKIEAVKKEARRVRVVLQRKDAGSVLFKEAKAVFLLMPPVPDVANLKERAEAPVDTSRDPSQLLLAQLPPDMQLRVTKPLVYDKDWPPEITKWKYEGYGNYSHDFSLYRAQGLMSELGMYVKPETMKGYVRGTKQTESVKIDGNTVTWMGKGMSWMLTDSRDLVCKVVFTTKRPAVKQEAGPAGCVAVYSTLENNKLIASMTVPLIKEVTEMRVIKQFSYNRLNISWEGAKRRRGFTIPDHTPLRVVIGVNCYYPGEEADTLIEIDTCPQAGDAW